MILPVKLPPLLYHLQLLLPKDQLVYLVGGAVRDLLLGLPLHDLDFALSRDTNKVARRIAEKLGAAFYLLDDERQTCRVVYWDDTGRPLMLDFVILTGNTIESDLLKRDFTVNAIAVDLAQPEHLIDPCGGMNDLSGSILRTCSPDSLKNDPLRILRGLRLSSQLQLKIDGDTWRLMQQFLLFLPCISQERVRDELFRMLDGAHSVVAIQSLEELGGLAYVLPGLEALRGASQSLPHVSDVWNHTLAVISYLDKLVDVFLPAHGERQLTVTVLSEVVTQLEDFKPELNRHFSQPITPNRTRVGLLKLAALYHDAAKPVVKAIDENGRIHALGHEILGAELAVACAHSLALSNAEGSYLQTVVRHHMRVHQLAAAVASPSRKAVYRYFKDTGDVGVDLCLFSLADTLATYEDTLPVDVLLKELNVCRWLLEAWWRNPDQSVKPVLWVNGNDLITELDLSPGVLIGRLLEAVREAQAGGTLHSRQEALQFAQQWIKDHKDEN